MPITEDSRRPRTSGSAAADSRGRKKLPIVTGGAEPANHDGFSRGALKLSPSRVDGYIDLTKPVMMLSAFRLTR